MYQELYQEVIEYFSYQEFKTEYEKSRLEFESKIGKVFDDHPFFETWIETFIEFFTFDRFLPTYGITPVSLYYKMNKENLSDEHIEGFKKLIQNKLSVVRFDSKSGNDFYCTDLIEREPIILSGVDKSHELMLKKEDWLIVRSIEENGKNIVFGSIWHFPKEIQHVLRNNLKRIGKKLPFIHDCMAKKVFSERYKHVDLEKIYETNFNEGSAQKYV